MIPFEDEPSLTDSERYAEKILESNWDNVVRTTRGVLEDLRNRHPEICEILDREIREDAQRDVSDAFRPGIPDFLAFDDSGKYRFIEIKSSGDGLRHSQLTWIREFRGVNAEIWFTEQDTGENLNTEEIGVYTFEDRKGENSSTEARRDDGDYVVDIPDTIASITGIEDGKKLKWRLKSSDELILDTR